MIIITGAGPGKSKKYLLKKAQYCDHCHNTTQWAMQKNQQFVTLFFLPIIPYKTEYITYCPICGNTKKLNKEEFEQKVRFEAEPFNG